MTDSKIDYYSSIEIPEELVNKIDKLKKKNDTVREDLIRAFIIRYKKNYTVKQIAEVLEEPVKVINYIIVKLKAENLL